MRKTIQTFETHRHQFTKWLAIVSIVICIPSLLMGAQPTWLWLGITFAYTVQLQLVRDIDILKMQHVKELQQLSVRRLYRRPL